MVWQPFPDFIMKRQQIRLMVEGLQQSQDLQSDQAFYIFAVVTGLTAWHFHAQVFDMLIGFGELVNPFNRSGLRGVQLGQNNRRPNLRQA